MRNERQLSVYGELEYANSRFHQQDNPWDHWQMMPHFDPRDSIDAYATLELNFDSAESVAAFNASSDMSITDRTKSTWYPQRIVNRYFGSRYVCDFYRKGVYDAASLPKYPIYIISKSRWEVRLSSDSLVQLGLKHSIVVEESQYEQYLSRVDPRYVTILILPQRYLDEYDTCDDLGSTKSRGPGAARNFCWDHSLELGFERHWVMDDNQAGFYRHDADKRTRVLTGAMFRAMEDHTDRYENVLISGPNYRFFAVPGPNLPPFVANTRIYSCLLIKNAIPYRWRGRYNEDTDLSLRVLKDGYCTIQYNAFTTGKIVTQAMAGGNTEAFYSKEGTLPKSQMLVDLHPDVAEVKWMNNRWHHIVDYRPFRGNRLKYKQDVYFNPDSEYNMSLEDVQLEAEEADE